jgi:hypothetical protein
VTTEEFGMGYALLVEGYKKQLEEMTDDERKAQRKLYYKYLKEMDPLVWQEVCGVAIQSSKWFPKISELVGYATDVSRLLSGAGGADEAFSLALTAVRRLDPLVLKPMSPVREDVDRTVRSLGGWERLALVESSELGWYRKEFHAVWEGAHGLRDRLSAAGGITAGRTAIEQAHQERALVAGQPREGEGVLDAVIRALEATEDVVRVLEVPGEAENHTGEGK